MKYTFTIIVFFILAWVICSCLTKRENADFLSRGSTEAMKGAAILCIVLCHFMGTFGGGIVWFTPLGGIGVSVFLMLSAYGLNESWRGGVPLLVEETNYCGFAPICGCADCSLLVVS